MTNQFYVYERGTLRSLTAEPLYWEGMVGLMYPSDYGYAAGNSCVSGTKLYNYNGGCRIKDWLYISNDHQWLMSPHSDDSRFVFYVGKGGLFDTNLNDYTYAVRPVFYLNSSASITNGDGSLNNPYLITLE